MPFLDSLDIANRALQQCGAPQINTVTEDSNNNLQASFAYDKVRRAELRRNVWRFATRKAALRAIDTTTMLLDPDDFAGGSTYLQGAIVKDPNGLFWINQVAENTTDEPGGNNETWDMYFGPKTVTLYDADVTYFAGELVYKETGNPGEYKVYLSLQNANDDDPATATDWDADTLYNKDDVVTYSATMWRSDIEVNRGITPVEGAYWTALPTVPETSIKWREIDAGVKNLTFIYPIGTGPVSQASSRNVFRLPCGFLREAPQSPKAYEGDYIVSSDAQPIIFRFVADITIVSKMDDMFCEGLACRIATAICEPLTQSATKLQTIASAYKLFMGEARLVNAIEVGPEEPPEDNYVACRA